MEKNDVEWPSPPLKEDRIKKALDKGLFVLEWIIKFWIVLSIVWLVYDFNIHPENYAVVDERLEKNESMSEFGKTGQINYVPNYMYTASTTEECKPLKSLGNYYKRWLKPLLFLIVIYSILALIIRYNLLRYLKEALR